MSDEIRLVLPAQEDFRHIAHLVVGGLGARLDLTFEALEDVQVAVEALLGCRDDGGELIVTLSVEGGDVRAFVGPFTGGQLDELRRDGERLGLRRVLETVCDVVDVQQRDGASWVVFTKQTAAPAGAAG